MSNAIATFNFQSNQLRTIKGADGEPWFVLADVCAVLGIGNSSDVSRRLDDDEKDDLDFIDTIGRTQRMTAISESGLYAVILRSNKPEAKPFRRWVTGEVLPAIRKTGAYHAPNVDLSAIVAAEIARQLVAYIPTNKAEPLLVTAESLADTLESWLADKGLKRVSKTHVRQRAPASLRNIARLNAAIKVLVGAGKLAVVRNGRTYFLETPTIH